MEIKKRKILLVEDDQVDQMAFKRMLKKQELAFESVTADCVADAKDALESDSFDLIMSDYNLGDGTAFDIIELAQGKPVIFVTGAGDEETAIKAMKAGAIDYVIKDHGRNYLEFLPIVIDKAVKQYETEKQIEEYHKNLEILVAERTKELAKEKELLGTTLSSMSDAVIALDTDMKIMLFNRIAEKMTGLSFNEVDGKYIEETVKIIDEESGDPVKSIFCTELPPEQKDKGSQYALVDQYGNMTSIAVNISSIKQDDGTIIGTVLVLRDITKERKIEQMKTGFVSSVSHELRTPLTSIKAFTATILRDPNMPDETRSQFLHIIDEESNRLGNLIEDLLEISRIESGTVKLDLKSVDVVNVMGQVLTPLEPLAEKKNITIEKNINGDLPELAADSDKLKSVITNLVNNAIKFTPEGGKITVSVESDTNEMILSVSDTGMGIPQDDLGKVFNRFHRVHRPGKEIQGTGLGLPIVKNIVEMHNGRIKLESEVDVGTTFKVYLPLVQELIKVESNN